jgi:hypothetical protein
MRAVIAQMPKHWLEERKKSEASQWDEMWSGVLYIPIMPNRLQQNIAMDLLIYLDRHWERTGKGYVHKDVNLTTPEDEPAWTLNYRIPDLVLLDPPRFGIDKIEYMVGAPLWSSRSPVRGIRRTTSSPSTRVSEFRRRG